MRKFQKGGTNKGVIVGDGNVVNRKVPVRLNTGEIIYVDSIDDVYLNPDSIVPVNDSVYVDKGLIENKAKLIKRKSQSNITNKIKKQFGESTYVERPKYIAGAEFVDSGVLAKSDNSTPILQGIYTKEKYPATDIRYIPDNDDAVETMSNGYKRSYFDAGKNTMYLGKGDEQALSAELSHAEILKKYPNGWSNNNQSMNDILDYGDEKRYEIPGTVEYEAHKIIQPRIEEDYRNYARKTRIGAQLQQNALPAILGRKNIPPVVKEVFNKAAMKKQFGGTSQNILAENGELYLDENDEIQEVRGFSHDDPFIELPDGQKIISSKGQGGQILDDATSVLSDSYTQVQDGDRKNSNKEEKVAIKSKDAKKLFDYKWFNAGKNKKYSPSELVREVISQRDKRLSRYSDVQKDDALSLSTNQLNASLMPSDEDIYDVVLGKQENSKRSDFNVKAQYGGSTYVERPQRPLVGSRVKDDRGNKIYRDSSGRQLASGETEPVYPESILFPGTPIIKGLGKVGNLALDTVNPISGVGTKRLYRIENPNITNKYFAKKGDLNLGTSVSHEDLVGQWFSDDIEKPLTYLQKSQKQPGSQVVYIDIPVNELEKYKAINHPIASKMDIEPTQDYIISDRSKATIINLDDIPRRTGNYETWEPSRNAYLNKLNKKQYGGIPVNPNGLYEEDGPVIIPSGNITMEGIDYPVEAYNADTGEYLDTMQPDENYQFDANNILEIPMNKAQFGEDGTYFPPKYTIKQGDSLSKIAESYGLTLQQLLDENPTIANANRINVGDTLTIPDVTIRASPTVEPVDRSSEIADIQELPEELNVQAEDVIPTLDVSNIVENVAPITQANKEKKKEDDKIKLGKIDRTQGTNALREMMRANRSINLPYRSEVPRRLYDYIEEDVTPYLDELDSQSIQALQNVNQNTAQGQAIAANILNRVGMNKRQIINRANAMNLQRRQQVDNQNVALQNQFDMMQEQSNKNYVDETYQTLANYDRNRVQQAEYLDEMINQNARTNNFFTMENMRNPNYQIDPVTGEVFRIGTPLKQSQENKAQFGIKRKKNKMC